ncbi:DUF4296 domain-containing protein [Solitalea lacus]|uniref:DUF4296 domain-containing protein n=1 Tax=Solitalea lacus TaxID=2911172 RepID=UPI0021073CA3|nr:DUF4296 domain-containing protein [Solitalea lacus]
MESACSTSLGISLKKKVNFITPFQVNLVKLGSGLLLILTIWSCSNKNKPSDLIPKEKMKNILMDMHLVESRSFRISNSDSAKRVTKASYQFIFKKYKIDTAQLRSSLEYYLSEPELLDNMYEQMIDSLSKRQTKLVKEDRKDMKPAVDLKLDSIKKDSIKLKKQLKERQLTKDSIKRDAENIKRRFNVKKHPVM